MPAKPRNFVASAAWLLALLVGAGLLAVQLPAGPMVSSAPDSARNLSRDSSAQAARRAAPHAAADIRSLLDAQAAAWNRGDVDGFMAGYWNSDQTAFAGSQGILHGWQALLDRYRKTYPDRKAMGTLEFSALEITLLCPDAALVLGKWHLEREAGPVGGVFNLVLRNFPGGWRIIADHTSVVPGAAPGSAR
ncbi:MAG TPA: nuclear transport factor 2 family protein [Candidatus Acidoferrales bacterium]|nr:nuclear transport factor 2 family protein [Candidatus Acidoferrales bacterium]